jgi:hypothetical protein
MALEISDETCMKLQVKKLYRNGPVFFLFILNFFKVF